jgi:hypothetical protein
MWKRALQAMVAGASCQPASGQIETLLVTRIFGNETTEVSGILSFELCPRREFNTCRSV